MPSTRFTFCRPLSSRRADLARRREHHDGDDGLAPPTSLRYITFISERLSGSHTQPVTSPRRESLWQPSHASTESGCTCRESLLVFPSIARSCRRCPRHRREKKEGFRFRRAPRHAANSQRPTITLVHQLRDVREPVIVFIARCSPERKMYSIVRINIRLKWLNACLE